jgi:hypothetical protein
MRRFWVKFVLHLAWIRAPLQPGPGTTVPLVPLNPALPVTHPGTHAHMEKKYNKSTQKSTTNDRCPRTHFTYPGYNTGSFLVIRGTYWELITPRNYSFSTAPIHWKLIAARAVSLKTESLEVSRVSAHFLVSKYRYLLTEYRDFRYWKN